MSTEESLCTVGKNVSLEVEGTCLMIKCDLSKDFGESASGKTITIASTSGNKPIGETNAFLGMNLFVKSLEKRNLKEGVLPLLSDEFVSLDDGLEWRIDPEDKVTLCVKIDFSKTKERMAGSGKSYLIASSKGNKEVGKTGILCGLNCYRSVNATFHLDKLASDIASGGSLSLTPPTIQKVGEFSIDYPTKEQLTIKYDLKKDSLGEKDIVKLPMVSFDGNSAQLFIGAYKDTKRKKQDDSEGAVRQGIERQISVRNVDVDCTKEGSGEGGETVYKLEFKVNPSLSFGRTSSAKSIAVASTGGFKVVYDQGEPVCRVSVNFYKSTPITEEEVRVAVHGLLKDYTVEKLRKMSLKEALAEVLKNMQLGEEHSDLIKEFAKTHLKSIVSDDS